MTFREWDELLEIAHMLSRIPVHAFVGGELYLHSENGIPAVWMNKDTTDGCYPPCDIIATAVFP